MRQIYVTKPINLNDNSDSLKEAKALKITLSATLEAALITELKAARRALWLAENKQAIDPCNLLTKSSGLFSEKNRIF